MKSTIVISVVFLVSACQSQVPNRLYTDKELREYAAHVDTQLKKACDSNTLDAYQRAMARCECPVSK